MIKLERTGAHRFLVLLAALALLLTTYPIVEGGGRAGLVFQVCFELVLLAGLFSMRSHPAWFWIGVTLAGPAVVLTWWSLTQVGPRTNPASGVEVAGLFAHALYLCVLIVFVLRDLFSSTVVTVDRLCGAICVYLLLGVAWGFVYTGLEVSVPGSFSLGEGLHQVADANLQDPLERSGVLFYYSFVTLTTLGYGDVSPLSPTAQMLSMWEAIVGQAYLTILVARLVGLHVGSSLVPKESDRA